MLVTVTSWPSGLWYVCGMCMKLFFCVNVCVVCTCVPYRVSLSGPEER